MCSETDGETGALVAKVDRISWVVNPPSEDLAAVTLSDYFIRGPYHWYQSVRLPPYIHVTSYTLCPDFV